MLNDRRSQGHAILLSLNAERCGALLLSLFDRLDDLVEVRPVACIECGMEQFAIGANLKGAAARGDQRERFEALAELKNFGRQTDGFRRVVSNNAVFDRDFGLHPQTPFRCRNYRRGSKRSSCTVILIPQSREKDLALAGRIT